MHSLAMRLQAALEASGISQAELARHCRVKASSVSDWLSGESKSMKSAPLLRAAALLGVNPLWLATGEGTRRSSGYETAGASLPVLAQEAGVGSHWPFSYITPQRWTALPLSDRLRIEMFADQLLQAHDAMLRAKRPKAM